MDFYFAVFDPEKHFCLETVLSIFPDNTGMPSDEVIDPGLYSRWFGAADFPLKCQDTSFRHAESLVYSSKYMDFSSNRNLL